MAKLNYTWDELMASHAYARPHEEAGYSLHGGFDASGKYISPRTLNRWPAVEAWQEKLTGRGWPLIDATVQLLKRGHYPNIEQQKLLLSNGLGETLWNSLTITGIIEARGQALCQFEAPDFQQIIVDDISDTCTGHLHKGLLYAHGIDEGGDPKAPEGPGAHDQMWFAARDMIFGKDRYPIPEVPENIGRPDQGRLMPQIPAGFEQLILLLMNVLMIEVRAESGFSFNCELLRDPATFTDRRAAAELAAAMIERIRTDEAIHVAYLQTTVSEMRSFTFKTVDGGTIAGKDMIDPIWEGMVHWHAVTQAELARDQSHEAIRKRFGGISNGSQLLDAYEQIDDRARAA
ncbi:MAG: hypothetical protein K8R18_07975 [Parvibaculum sp.]|uniref:hypothetical protein n=1 Tax=Parvibaculum sp. TaxID=2024848 RepID=UPI0025E044F7|nr:hypothetical protein [Parvibaculum sp.]MCE9649546.1 hypothetical protein [Parvibaculum sp.]